MSGTVEYVENMVPGHGWEPDLALSKGQVIDWQASTIDQNPGLEIVFELTVKESSQELVRSLDLSADASYSGYGVSGSVSVDYTKTQSKSRLNTYVLARCLVRKGAENLTNIVLKDQVVEDAEQLTHEAFLDRYGQWAISGLVSGGFFAGVIEIETTDIGVKNALKVAADFSGWGAEASAEVSREFSEITKNLAKSVHVYRRGGGGNVETSIEDMINLAVEFPEAVRGEAKRVQAILTEMRTYVQLPVAQDPATAFRRAADFRLMARDQFRSLEVQDDLALSISKYTRTDDAGDDVLEFVGEKPSLEAFQSSFEEFGAHITNLDENMQRCRSGDNYIVPTPIGNVPNLPKGMRPEMQIVPIGSIIMWAGPGDAVPRGFALCDGLTPGVPDLRDRFIMGADRGNIGEMGEGDPHSHSIDFGPIHVRTTNGGAHTHNLPNNWYARSFDDGRYRGIDVGSGGYNENRTLSQHTGHNHSVTVDLPPQETTTRGGLRPRYYALAYIMKV